MQRAVFSVLVQQSAGMPVQEILQRAEELCPATEYEDEDYPNQPGRRRYPTMVRFATIAPVKAGWLVKDKGIWRLTDEGRAAYVTYSDPAEFQAAAAAGYRTWQAANTAPIPIDADEAAEDVAAIESERGTARPRHAWLIRGANVDGVNMLPRWFSEGFCSIATELPDLPVGTSRQQIARHV